VVEVEGERLFTPPTSCFLCPMPPKTMASKRAPVSTHKGQSTRSKKPTKPKAPLPVDEQLKRLFNSLCAQIDGGHLPNAIKTCDKSLCSQSSR
jgi:signal recognition particle subunit SRP72